MKWIILLIEAGIKGVALACLLFILAGLFILFQECSNARIDEMGSPFFSQEIIREI